MTWLRRLAMLAVGVAVAGSLTLWGYAHQALPQTDGRLSLPGVPAEVSIERDATGIPTIRAASPNEAMFGLGFVHAQDRLWQLETHRRIGSGRLAEAFGPPAVETDKFLRALGVKRAAEAQWANASAESRAALVAYTAGVNAFIQSAMKARPPADAIFLAVMA